MNRWLDHFTATERHTLRAALLAEANAGHGLVSERARDLAYQIMASNAQQVEALEEALRAREAWRA